MLDTAIRPLIDPPLNAAGRRLAAWGIGANALTLAGLAVGLAAAVTTGLGEHGLALALIAANRVLDGLDGAVARATGSTDFGGYLDLFCDFVFYASIPLGFAFARPEWALPAACLLAGFVLAGISFVGYALAAGRRGLETRAQGEKSFYYQAGLIEGTETIAFFVVVSLRPEWFAAAAYAFAVLCAITASGRLALGWRRFR